MDSPEPIFNSSPPASPSATPTTASTHYSLAAARATESPPDYSTPDTDDTTTIAGTEKDNVQGKSHLPSIQLCRSKGFP